MRLFNRKQKIQLYVKQKGKCNMCSCELNYEYEADHITEYSRGGKTILSNGQLLCKLCHKRKTKMNQKLKLRKWQEEGLLIFENKLRSNENKMLVVATPGAGKTIFASKCMEQFYNAHDGNVIFIVLVPNKSLQRDWSIAANKATNGKAHLSYNKPLIKGLNFGDHNGTVSCYQSVNNDAIQYTKHGFELASYKGTKVMVVFDEAHHMAVENEWGKSATEMFRSCDFFLSISGTPFRTDNTKIPFFNYDQDGKLAPDITYSYSDAIKDDVCRDVVFKSTNGEVEFYSNDGEIIKTDIDLEDIDEKHVSQAVNHTLDPDSEIVKHLIMEATAKLDSIRMSEHKKAGGIVFCKSIHHAKKIADKFYEYTGKNPYIVHSGVDDALNQIDMYKNSDNEWVISVNMISEGKDIQRLRVGLWLSNVSAKLKLIQSLGRVLRVQKELSHDQTAYFFMPKFDYLVQWAKEIMDEIEVAVQEKIEREMTQRKERDQPVLNMSHLIGSQAKGQETIYDGANISNNEMANMNKWLSECGIDIERSKIPLEHYIKIYKASTQKENANMEEPAEYEEMDIQAVIDKLKTIAAKKVATVHHITKEEYWRINQAFNEKYRRGKSTTANDMTVDEYKKKIQFLDHCIKHGRIAI